MSQPLQPDAAASECSATSDETCGWRCGHRRTATIGKALPVSALLLNYQPSPVSSLRARNSAAEHKPIFFTIDEGPLSPVVSASGLCSFLDGSDNGDERRASPPPPPPPQPTGRDTAQAPCLFCLRRPYSVQFAAIDTLGPINELCRLLCTDACRSQLSLDGYVSLSRLRAPRRAEASLADIVNTSVPPSNVLSLPVLPPLPLPPLPPALGVKRRMESLRRQFLDDILDDTAVDGGGDAGIDKDFREKVEIAEVLARTSAMTSTAQMKRRLAARKLELDLESAQLSWDDTGGDSGGANVRRHDAADSFTSSSAHRAEGGCDRGGSVGAGPAAVGKKQQEITDDGDADGDDDDNAPDNMATPTATKKKQPLINSESEPPPRQLLLYLVRMGSFNSTPKINNIDSQDDDLHIPKGLSNNELLQHVQRLRGMHQPPLLSRYFCKPSLAAQMVANDITDGLRSLKLSAVSKDCLPVTTSPNRIRLLQWNILSQTLGQSNDGFVRCPEEALTWENRKYLIVQEILQNDPDIVCLQEVDHYKFLQNILGTQNYEGVFFPKPDSPCLYIEQNNGPDGCAIFFKRDKFELKSCDTRVLEVWQIQSNQVAIAANLLVKATGVEICVCTTHLKARHGSLLSKLRNEQGRDLIRFVKQCAGERPVLLCGDFNAEPIEPVYTTILNCDTLKLSSAYADIDTKRDECNNEHGEMSNSKNFDVQRDENGHEDEHNEVHKSIEREPPYTTWKIREDGEVCHTIDYVFYSKDQLKVKNCLEFPQGDEIGQNRTPSFQYPSDHFSLVCDFEIIEKQEHKQKQMSETQ